MHSARLVSVPVTMTRHMRLYFCSSSRRMWFKPDKVIGTTTIFFVISYIYFLFRPFGLISRDTHLWTDFTYCINDTNVCQITTFWIWFVWLFFVQPSPHHIYKSHHYIIITHWVITKYQCNSYIQKHPTNRIYPSQCDNLPSDCFRWQNSLSGCWVQKNKLWKAEHTEVYPAFSYTAISLVSPALMLYSAQSREAANSYTS